MKPGNKIKPSVIAATAALCFLTAVALVLMFLAFMTSGGAHTLKTVPGVLSLIIAISGAVIAVLLSEKVRGKLLTLDVFMLCLNSMIALLILI